MLETKVFQRNKTNKDDIGHKPILNHHYTVKSWKPTGLIILKVPTS